MQQTTFLRDFFAGVLKANTYLGGANTYLGAGWPAGTILGTAPMALTAPVIATGGTEGLTTGIWGLKYMYTEKKLFNKQTTRVI